MNVSSRNTVRLGCIIFDYKRKLFGWSIDCLVRTKIFQAMPTPANLDTSIRTQYFVSLEMYNWLVACTKRPKLRNSVSHWGPDSMNYTTTYAIFGKQARNP